MGDDAIAANSVASVVFQILTVVVYGAANASSIIIGKTIGQGAEKLVPFTQKRRGSPPIAWCRHRVCLFRPRLGAGLLCHFAGEQTTGQRIYDGAQRHLHRHRLPDVRPNRDCGGGDNKFVLFNDMIFVWLVVIPLSSLAAFVWGLPPMAVFIFLKCDQVLKCFVAAVKVNRFRWIRRLTD